jgi:hypothetical protein
MLGWASIPYSVRYCKIVIFRKIKSKHNVPKPHGFGPMTSTNSNHSNKDSAGPNA